MGLAASVKLQPNSRPGARLPHGAVALRAPPYLALGRPCCWQLVPCLVSGVRPCSRRPLRSASFSCSWSTLVCLRAAR